jgi:hypothetical protein
MTTPQQELYAFHHLSLIDMQRVWESLDARRHARKKAVREALFRDAVVSYSCPFKTNRGVFGKLKIDPILVPESLKPTHDEVVALRDQIVAHNDLTEQNLQFGPEFSFTVTGYASIHRDYLAKPLSELAHRMHDEIMDRMFEMREGV